MSAVPKFMGKVNKRVFNPREIRNEKRPVLIHAGRSSGTEYWTPLDAHRVDGGYVFVVMYGSDCDWVQNVLASGEGNLRIDGGFVSLTNPRLIDRPEAIAAISADTPDQVKAAKRAEFLRMDSHRTTEG